MILKEILVVGVVVENNLIKVPSSVHLRYNRFRQNFKSNNYIHHILEGLCDNNEGNVSSSLINLCHYIAECHEEEFLLATGDSSLNFSGQISAIETTSMMHDVGINIS